MANVGNQAATDTGVVAGAVAKLGGQQGGRLGIFLYDIVVLVALVAVGGFYVAHGSGGEPEGAVSLTIEAMWFGALGGTMISMKGIYDHASGADGWDAGYNLWHLGRPFTGAVAGIVTVVLLMVVNGGGTAPAGLPSQPVVYIAAFIFGTQERRFFGFLSQTAQMIIHVPDDDARGGLAVTSVSPNEAAAGAVVIIRGQNIDPNATARLGTTAIENLVVSDDGSSAAGLVPAKPDGADTVDVAVVNPTGTSFVLADRFRYL